MKILELSATELAKKIKAGEISVTEAAKASLAQIAKEDQKIRSHKSRYDRRKPVVITKFHLIGGNGIVLIYDGYHSQL